MYYYLYKVTNNLNGKFYIGVHSSEVPNDEYMGSGKLIKKAISKYGKDNFTKLILESFNSEEEMYIREADVVDALFVKREDTYNMGCGGLGGTIRQNRKPFAGPHSTETKNKIRESSTGKIITEETRKKLSENNWSKKEPDLQKRHASNAAKKRHEIYIQTSEDTKNKISEALKRHNKENRERNIPHPVTGIKREKVVCPHCDKHGATNTMVRFHFDNCKLRSMV